MNIVAEAQPGLAGEWEQVSSSPLRPVGDSSLFLGRLDEGTSDSNIRELLFESLQFQE